MPNRSQSQGKELGDTVAIDSGWFVMLRHRNRSRQALPELTIRSLLDDPRLSKAMSLDISGSFPSVADSITDSAVDLPRRISDRATQSPNDNEDTAPASPSFAPAARSDVLVALPRDCHSGAVGEPLVLAGAA
jgi:hypothetical protein